MEALSNSHIVHHNDDWVSQQYITRFKDIRYRLIHKTHVFYPMIKLSTGEKTDDYKYTDSAVRLNSKTGSNAINRCECNIPDEVLQKHLTLLSLFEMGDRLR
jgi:hypothetical protein